MLRVAFEPMISVFEWVKRIDALDTAAIEKRLTFKLPPFNFQSALL
jgi:hypothetical protein